MKIICNNVDDTINLGMLIGSKLTKGDIIFLRGDLGAGKTTFTKGIGKALGVNRVINSPTFTIVKEYDGNIKLYHLDLYRLEEDYDLEIDEYFNSESICICEWPKERMFDFYNDYIYIEINRLDEFRREFNITSKGRMSKIVGELHG